MRTFTLVSVALLISLNTALGARPNVGKLGEEVPRLGELEPKTETRCGTAVKKLDPVAPADKAALYQKPGFTFEVQYQVKTGMAIDVKIYKNDHHDIQGCDELVDASREFSSWKRDPDTPDFAHWTRQDGRAFADYHWDSHVLHIWRQEADKLNKGTK